MASTYIARVRNGRLVAAGREVRRFLRWAHDEGVDVPLAFVHKYLGEAWATFKVPARQLPLLLD